MLNYAQIATKPRILKSLTGLTPATFQRLLKAFRQANERAQAEVERQRTQPRQRQPGGGRKPVLGRLADQMVFILFYFRLYPTQEALGFFFGMSQGQANYWIYRLTPLLNEALG